MSEINGPKISVNQVNYSGIQKQTNEVPAETSNENTPQINDFSMHTRYDILDGLRGVAAVSVLVYHLFEAFAEGWQIGSGSP